MAEQNRLVFPFDFKEMESKEKAEYKRLFNYPNVDLVRLVPKGYILYRNFIDEAEDIYNLPIRPSDVFVGSYSRSGTTWTQELVWLLANDLDYETALAVPITRRYPFLESFIYYDGWKNCLKYVDDDEVDSQEIKETMLKRLKIMSQPVTEKFAAMPSPRFIKTHVPICMLPPTLVDTAKMVYIARDPRDVAVSSYHLAKLFRSLDFAGEFKEFWDMFMNGRFIRTPYFEQIKEAWALRNHPNMLFLFYEELSKDLPAVVHRVADLLGKVVTDAQMIRLCDHLSFESFRKNKSVNHEDLHEEKFFSPSEKFIRKGKTNGWRDYFDEEMTQKAEQWIADNLQDTDLRFPHF